MKNKIFKLFSILLTMLLVFSSAVCVVNAEEDSQAVYQDITFISRGITGADGKNTTNVRNNRIATADFLTISNYDSISISEGYVLGVAYYTSKASDYSGYTGTKKTVNADGSAVTNYTFADAPTGALYFRLEIKRKDDANTDVNSLADYGLVLTKSANAQPESPIEPPQPDITEKPETPEEIPEQSAEYIPMMTQGTLVNGAINSNVTTRVVTLNLLPVSEYTFSTVATGYKAAYHFYDADGNWLGKHGDWKQGQTNITTIAGEITGAAYFRVIIGYENNDELIIVDLPDDALILNLALGVTPSVPAAPKFPDSYSSHITNRGNGLENTFAKLNNGEEINVVYMGGSVTRGTGIADLNVREKYSWRGLVGKWLEENKGNGKINNINASYGNTGSLFGAYRLQSEILPLNPDLIFIEFAINDKYNKYERPELDIASQYESIVRRLREEFPDCDIVTLYIIDQTDKGYSPSSVQKHDSVASVYDIPAINLGQAMHYAMKTSGLEWDYFFGDIVHPNIAGNKIYYNVIEEYLESQKTKSGDNTTVTEHNIPEIVSEELFDTDVEYIDMSEEYIADTAILGTTGFVYTEESADSTMYNSLQGAAKATAGNDSVLAVQFKASELAMPFILKNVYGCAVSIDGGEYKEIEYDNVCPFILAKDLDPNVTHTALIKPIFTEANGAVFSIPGFFTRTIKNEEHNHIYDHACDTTCNVEGCGFTRTTEHSIKYHEETETTPCQSPGVKEHWYCENCMARFSDEEGTNEVEYDSLLKLDEMTYQHDYDNEVDTDCNWCGMTREIVGTHVVADPETGAKYYYVNGVKSTATGLVEFEGKQMYINKGRFLGSSGLVTIGGKKMYINKGYFTGASGLVTISGKKTYINKGYFTGASGLVTISGKKAYINKGYFTGASGIVTLNGKKMYISKGYFLGKSGLVTVGGKKAYINKGYFTGATGIVTINGKKHYINKGYFTGASGKVKVGGKTYTVVKGIVK